MGIAILGKYSAMNFYRIKPKNIMKVDVIESFSLAMHLAKAFSESNLILMTESSYKLIYHYEHVLGVTLIRSLLLGNKIKYDGVNIQFKKELDSYSHVVLSINYLPDEQFLYGSLYKHMVVLAEVDPDIHSLPYDFWLINTRPRQF
ncbi:hypothetical protein ACTVKO_23865 [Serratia nevei]|uniref:hypothetical protein n=1 Tax=Serratia nevei TaxID=2703794 RepID=UPI003FA76621